MLGALKAAAKKEAAANPSKIQPTGEHKHHHHHHTAGGKKTESKEGKEGKDGKGAHHHHHHHHKKKKKSHDFEEEAEPLHHQCGNGVLGVFLTILHGIQGGCGSIVTCGICFDRYSEKQEMVEPEDEHDTKCQPDTKVLSWLTILVIIVSLFGYLISISFEALPMYVRAEFFDEKSCRSGTIKYIEYVPTQTCIKWKKQSLSVKKRPKKLDPGQSSAVVQSGRPPKKPESVVYTFTEHYMWGLSWYADLYQREGCLDAAGVPDSIAKVESLEMGTTVEPLYFMSQLRDVCLNRDEWDYDGKSARLLGSRCLGNQHMQDILGMFDDPECKSLVKATAYNISFYIAKKSPKNVEKWEKCVKSEIDGMYYKRIVPTPACTSKYDSYGTKIIDNGLYTDEPECSSELECPDSNGDMQTGTATKGMDTPTILVILLLSLVLPCLGACVFYSMTCHTVQKKLIKREVIR